MQALKLIIEVVLIVLKWYYDPERMQRAVNERLDRERQERRKKFRKAVEKRDADTVSGMLSDVGGRVRRSHRVPGGKR